MLEFELNMVEHYQDNHPIAKYKMITSCFSNKNSRIGKFL